MITHIKIQNILGLSVNAPIRQRVVFINGGPDSGKSRLVQAINFAGHYAMSRGQTRCWPGLYTDYRSMLDDGFNVGRIEIRTSPDRKFGCRWDRRRLDQRLVDIKDNGSSRFEELMAAYGPGRSRIFPYNEDTCTLLSPAELWSAWKASSSLELHGCLGNPLRMTMNCAFSSETEDNNVISYLKSILSNGPVPNATVDDICKFEPDISFIIDGKKKHLTGKESTRSKDVIGLSSRRRIGIVLDLVINIIGLYGKSGLPHTREGVVLIDDHIEPDLACWMINKFENMQFFFVDHNGSNDRFLSAYPIGLEYDSVYMKDSKAVSLETFCDY